MVLDRSHATPAVPVRDEPLWAVAIVVLVAALIIAANALFGWNTVAPPFDSTVDPAGAMPF